MADFLWIGQVLLVEAYLVDSGVVENLFTRNHFFILLIYLIIADFKSP